MGPFAAGQIVLLRFPFSDLSQSKLRPALLLSSAGPGDWIACQITSNPYGDPAAIPLTRDAFLMGDLERASYIRPAKLFTANESLFVRGVATITPQMLEDVRQAVVAIIRGDGA